MNTKSLSDSNLKEEMAKIADFINDMLLVIDGKENNVLITPQIYSRHMAAMYLVLECARAEVFLEAKATGHYESFNRLNAFLKDLGI